MPKVVDHQQRKLELVEATWRIIARRGLAGATMRQIAAGAGFANGALKPYFPTRDELIRATYAFVFDRTNERVAAGTQGLRAFEALEAFCREVLPLDADRLDEARVVMSFWSAAAQDPHDAEADNRYMDEWLTWMMAWLEQARDDGQLGGGVEISTAAEGLLNFMLGAQISAVLGRPTGAVGDLQRQLSAQLDRIRVV